jgi:hypothetical protein
VTAALINGLVGIWRAEAGPCRLYHDGTGRPCVHMVTCSRGQASD